MEHESRPGLRERKKLETRTRIAAAALDLFGRNGFQGTTIPEIAAAANVSPRTVSTYFPSKEDIVFEDWEAELANLNQALADRRPGEQTTDAVRAWLASENRVWETRADEYEIRRRVIDSDEGLGVIERSHFHEFGKALAEGISTDMGLEPTNLAPRLAAAAMAAIFDLLKEERFGDEGPGAADFEHQMRILDQGLRFVAGGVDAIRHTGQGS